MSSTLNLSVSDIHAFEKIAAEPGSRLSLKVAALLERGKGTIQRIIHEKLEVPMRTLSKWFHDYKTKGLESLKDSKRSGRPHTSDVTDAQVRNLIYNAQPIHNAFWTAKGIADHLGVSTSIVNQSCLKQNIDLVKMRSFSSLEAELKDKPLALVGLYLSENCKICVMASQENNLITDIPSVMTTCTPTSKTSGRGIHDNILLSISDALISSKQINENTATLDSLNEEYFLTSIKDSYKDVPGSKIIIFAQGVSKNLISNFDIKAIFDDVDSWMKGVKKCSTALIGEKKGTDLFLKELHERLNGNYNDFSWILVPAKSNPDRIECKPNITITLKFENGDDYTEEVVKMENNFERFQNIWNSDSIIDFSSRIGEIENIMRKVESTANRCFLNSIINNIRHYDNKNPISWRKGKIETIFGRLVTFIPTRISKDLAPNEYIWTPTVAKIAIEKATKVSYRNCAEDLNYMLNRNNNDEFSPNHIENFIFKSGKYAESYINEILEKNLKENNYFEIKELKEGSSDNLNQPHNQPTDEKTNGVSNIAIKNKKQNLYDKISQFVETINSNLSLNLNVNYVADQIEDDPQNTIYLNFDGVQTKYQAEKRKTKKGGVRSKKKKIVEVMIAWIHSKEGTYRITCRNTKELSKAVLAFLAYNKMLSKDREIVIITDGAREIRDNIKNIFEKIKDIRVKHILDWYHITKRVNEYMSMALKTGKENRNNNEKIKGKILNFMWYGDTDRAINYINNIDKQLIRNKTYCDKMSQYLSARKPFICCYALRELLGLINSSNRVETCNKMILSDRQKNNGTSWSEDGSFYLALLKTLMLNSELYDFLLTRKIRFAPE